MFEIDGPNRSDWMVSRGRNVMVTVGPFDFWVDTADGGQIGFGITVGGWSAGWAFDRSESAAIHQQDTDRAAR